jgi:hypothetical protein
MPAPLGEFYVGYLPKAPASLARLVRMAAALLLAGAMALAITLVFAQSPFAPASFEYQQVRAFHGVVRETPVPHLLLARPGSQEYSRYLLVGPGKHGAKALTDGLDGRPVDLQGSLIYRDGVTLVEVAPGSVRPGGVSAVRVHREELGEVSLWGEIVDSKCHFGVMNPGNGHLHRDCAVRCISGGVPAVLVSRDSEGNPVHIVVTGFGKRVRDLVGVPVEIGGRLHREGDMLFLEMH